MAKFEITTEYVAYTPPGGEELKILLPGGGQYMTGAGVVGIVSADRSDNPYNTPFVSNPVNYLAFSLEPAARTVNYRKKRDGSDGKQVGLKKVDLPKELFDSLRGYIQSKISGENELPVAPGASEEDTTRAHLVKIMKTNQPVAITKMVIFVAPEFRPAMHPLDVEKRRIERGEAARVVVAKDLTPGMSKEIAKYLGGKGRKTRRKARKARKTRKSKPSVRRRGY